MASAKLNYLRAPMFSKEEQLLNPILDYYLNQSIEAILSGEFETLPIIRTAKISIVVNQHSLPYFTVNIEKGSGNAKFLIENCVHIEGEITPEDLKRIKAFYSDSKAQIILKKIWSSVK